MAVSSHLVRLCLLNLVISPSLCITSPDLLSLPFEKPERWSSFSQLLKGFGASSLEPQRLGRDTGV